jgi:hypothetical protein
MVKVELELEDYNYINTYLNTLRSNVLCFPAMLKASKIVAYL